jgi:hypothetical protein
MSNIIDRNINNPNNLAGMSYLMNNDLISNSLKPEIIEKSIIDKHNFNNYDSNTKSNEDIISTYESQLDNLLHNNNSNSSNNNDSNYVNTDDVTSDFDEFDQLLKSVKNDKDNDNNSNHGYNSDSDNYQNNNSSNRFTTNNNYNNKLNDILNNDSYIKDEQINKAFQEEEKKIILLEKIDILREDLSRDGINLRKIKDVDFNSSLDEIDQTYRILLIKNNRDRYREIAEECILSVSNGLERIFDGNNEYFGVQPDLSGYSDTVKIKLRRLRYETSTIASNIMEKYELSPITRICVELIPSMIIYSTLRKRNKNLNYNNTNMEDTINNIRNNE